VTRFQAAYVSGREIEAVVEKLRLGGRKSRRWPVEELVPAGVATGTEGRPQPVNGRGVAARVAHQLRLIK
jgi:hypothetical protein